MDGQDKTKAENYLIGIFFLYKNFLKRVFRKTGRDIIAIFVIFWS